MNRIDEIKERLEKVTHLRGIKGLDAREEFESCAEADIDYLLSLNERYKEALEEIAESDDDWYVGSVPMKEFAAKALEE